MKHVFWVSIGDYLCFRLLILSQNIGNHHEFMDIHGTSHEMQFNPTHPSHIPPEISMFSPDFARHSADPHARQPAAQEHQRAGPRGRAAPGSEALTEGLGWWDEPHDINLAIFHDFHGKTHDINSH